MSEIGQRSACEDCSGTATVAHYEGGSSYCFKCCELKSKAIGFVKPKAPISKKELRRIDEIWTGLVGFPGAVTAYHLTKGIKTHVGPARPRVNGILVVPIHDTNGTLRSLQQINAAGEKRFMKGGEIKGNYCVVTKNCALISKPATELVFVVEGYATGISAWQVFGRDVVVAFNAGNLKSVVRLFPRKKIVILADNDKQSQTGIKKAEEAAQGLPNVNVILTPEVGDFNDYVVKHGIEHTKDVYAKLLGGLI